MILLSVFVQNRARLLGELERLQQADLLRRRQAVNRIPAHIFQPLYRQEELRDEQQKDLEIAFQNMYTKECGTCFNSLSTPTRISADYSLKW